MLKTPVFFLKVIRKVLLFLTGPSGLFLACGRPALWFGSRNSGCCQRRRVCTITFRPFGWGGAPAPRPIQYGILPCRIALPAQILILQPKTPHARSLWVRALSFPFMETVVPYRDAGDGQQRYRNQGPQQEVAVVRRAAAAREAELKAR